MSQNFQELSDIAPAQNIDEDGIPATGADPNQLLYYYKKYAAAYLDLVSAKETISTLNLQAQDFTNSLSWKITKPLRWLRDRIAR